MKDSSTPTVDEPHPATPVNIGDHTSLHLYFLLFSNFQRHALNSPSSISFVIDWSTGSKTTPRRKGNSGSKNMTEYEKQRMKRLEENKDRMKAMGLDKMASSFIGSIPVSRNTKKKGKLKWVWKKTRSISHLVRMMNSVLQVDQMMMMNFICLDRSQSQKSHHLARKFQSFQETQILLTMMVMF